MSSSTISFSGLITGLDTTSLITALENAVKAPGTQLQHDQSDLSQQKSILGDLEARISGLSDAASTFDLASEAQAVTATTSDDSHLSIAVSGSATPASHDLRVLSTARAQVSASRTFASSGAGVLGAGSLTIQRAGATDVPVTWTASDSLADIADRITQAGAGVSASVLFDGTNYRLMVGATATGTAAAPTFVDGGDGLGLANPGSVTVAAKDAQLSIDGVTITRGKNVIDDALPGATITLKSPHAAAEADTAVTVAVDPTATQAQVQKIVSSFNAVASAIQAQLTYSGTTAPTNTLFGDSTLQSLQRNLNELFTGPKYGAQIAALGIAIDRTGQLSIDSTKFSAALAADPRAVAKLFTAGGLAGAVEQLSDTYTRAGDGILVAKSAGMDARIKLYQTQIDQIDANAQALGDRLTQQFNQLEQTMAKLKGTSNYLATSGSTSATSTLKTG